MVDNLEIYEGIHSSRSAIALPDNEESELSITLDVVADGDISFYKFVSSENNYDFLKFKINGQKLDEWSGVDLAWSFVSFPVISGVNTFKWEYEKDASQSDGQDCAWIDYIVFPPVYIAPSFNNEINTSIKIYPNPSKGIFNIYFDNLIEHNVQILDLNGKVLSSKKTNHLMLDYDLTQMSSGSYLIKIMPENIIYQILKQ